MGDTTGGTFRDEESDALFSVRIDGPGCIDWSYTSHDQHVCLEAVRDSTADTSLLIESLEEKSIYVESVSLSDPVGCLTFGAGVGAIEIHSNWDGAIQTMEGVVSACVHASWRGDLTVEGDLGRFEVAGDLSGPGKLRVEGNMDALQCGGVLAQSVCVRGSLGSVAAATVSGDARLDVGGDLREFRIAQTIGEKDRPVRVRVGGRMIEFTSGGDSWVDVVVERHLVSFKTLGEAPVIGSLAARSIDFLTVEGDFDADLHVRDSIQIVQVSGRLTPDRRFEVGQEVKLLIAGSIERPLDVAGEVGSDPLVELSVDPLLDPSSLPSKAALLRAAFFAEILAEDEEPESDSGERSEVAGSDVPDSEAPPEVDPVSTESDATGPTSGVEDAPDSNATATQVSGAEEGADDGVPTDSQSPIAAPELDLTAELMQVLEDAQTVARELRLEAEDSYELDEEAVAAAFKLATGIEDPVPSISELESAVPRASKDLTPADWRELIQQAHLEGKSFAEVFTEAACYRYSADRGELTPSSSGEDLPKITLDESDPKVAWLWGVLRKVSPGRED